MIKSKTLRVVDVFICGGLAFESGAQLFYQPMWLCKQ